MDDTQLLTELWREIDDIEGKLYSGLDSKAIGELEKVKFSGFSPAQIRTEQMVLWFLPEEVESIDAVIEAFKNVAAADRVYLAPLASYEKLFKLLVDKKRDANIKNSAVAIMALIDDLNRLKGAEAPNSATPSTSHD